jgi:hypothetical protein
MHSVIEARMDNTEPARRSIPRWKTVAVACWQAVTDGLLSRIESSLERKGGRGRDDPDSRQDVLHREIVQLGGNARRHVLRDDDLVAVFPSVA